MSSSRRPERRSAAVVRYESARAAREAALAERARLQVARLRGELISADDARTEWASFCARVQQGVLALPSWIGQRVPLTATQRALITRRCRDLLAELATDAE